MHDNIINIGIVGGGFVGKATAGFESSLTKVWIYDLQPHLRYPNENVTMNDIYHCNVVFVCVPTPMKKNSNECHTSIVQNVVHDIQSHSSSHIIIRSTVPIGTSNSLNTHFMPEFLTEKNWKQDFKECQNWILGISSPSITPLISQILENAKHEQKILYDNLLTCSPSEAETIKYFRNCFLATKVSFCNEIYRLCQALRLNYDTISSIASTDPRITPSHINVPGPDGKCGFGGTCFPKDVASLIHQFQSHNVESPLLSIVQSRNIEIDRPEQDWNTDIGRAVI